MEKVVGVRDGAVLGLVAAALLLSGCAAGAESAAGPSGSSPASTAPTTGTTSASPGASGLGVDDRTRVQAAVDELLDATPITFLPDSTTPTPAGAEALTRLGALLTPIAPARVTVTGYTSPERGDPSRATQLALQRAQAVADALVSHGVTRERLRTTGGGPDASRPGHGRTVSVAVT